MPCILMWTAPSWSLKTIASLWYRLGWGGLLATCFLSRQQEAARNGIWCLEPWRSPTHNSSPRTIPFHFIRRKCSTLGLLRSCPSVAGMADLATHLLRALGNPPWWMHFKAPSPYRDNIFPPQMAQLPSADSFFTSMDCYRHSSAMCHSPFSKPSKKALLLCSEPPAHSPFVCLCF